MAAGAVLCLLPRLLPVREPKRFMFATYVEEARAVMLRYIDVGAPQRVTLGGESMRAIPIKDRLGLEGSVTTHYVTSDGAYVGSENADNGIVVLPSTEEALLKIWKDANFSRPADAKEPPTAAGAAAPGPAPDGGAGSGVTNGAPGAAGVSSAPTKTQAAAGGTRARLPRERAPGATTR